MHGVIIDFIMNVIESFNSSVIGSDDEVDEPNRKHKKPRRSSPNADDSGKEKKPNTNETELSSEIREEESSCELTSLKEEGNEVENYIRLSTGNGFLLKLFIRQIAMKTKIFVFQKPMKKGNRWYKITLIEQCSGMTQPNTKKDI